MNILDWSHSSEIKELHCGAKPIVVQCSTMGCVDYCSVYDDGPICLGLLVKG